MKYKNYIIFTLLLTITTLKIYPQESIQFSFALPEQRNSLTINLDFTNHSFWWTEFAGELLTFLFFNKINDCLCYCLPYTINSPLVTKVIGPATLSLMFTLLPIRHSEKKIFYTNIARHGLIALLSTAYRYNWFKKTNGKKPEIDATKNLMTLKLFTYICTALANN